MSGEELADRRQRAREAFDDAWNVDPKDPHDGRSGDYSTWAERLQRAREEAIEAATRVRITPEIVAAARTPWMSQEETHKAVTAAFRAAGFEIEE